LRNAFAAWSAQNRGRFGEPPPGAALLIFWVELHAFARQHGFMNRLILLVLSLFVWGSGLKVSAQGAAFNYQGRLNAAGAPANGSYDLRFAVYDAVTNGNRVSLSLTNAAVAVTNGLFNVTLDFGAGLFAGTNFWLDIAVRGSGETNFTALVPRQPILPVPYAIFANTASNVIGSVSATQLTGTLPSAQLAGTYSGQVNFANAGNDFSGTFTGNGAALTGLNASQLTSGTVADARLTPNVALLDHNQTFTGVNAFTNRGNSFIGNFFGNGNVGWIPVSGTVTQAMPNAGYILLNANLTTLTLPATAALLPGDVVRVAGAGSGGWLVAENAGQSIVGNLASYRSSFLQAGNVGSDWRRLTSSSDGSRMYAAGNFSGGIYYSTDAGHSWNPTGITGSGWFSVACSADGNKVFAAPNGGIIQSSTNGGLTWANFSGSANWNAVACSADGNTVIAGASSGALALTGSGVTSPANGNWTAVACSGDGSKLAAAISSTVYTSTNGGVSWRSSSLPGSCSALAAAASGLKLVATYSGGVATSTNFGLNWTTTNPSTSTAWSCLAASSDCTRLVAGVNNGRLYASANFGAAWTSLSTTNQYWSGACLSADGTKFAAAVSTVGGAPGGIYFSSVNAQPNTVSTNSTIGGSQGSAVELLHVGNGQFMPVSSSGALWAN
jgi:hypothetical protein